MTTDYNPTESARLTWDAARHADNIGASAREWDATARELLRDLADQLESAVKEVERLTKERDRVVAHGHEAITQRDSLRAEIERLKKLNEACDKGDWRTKREEQIDAIADALGDDTEWSNLSDRGDNALEAAIVTVAERDTLRQHLAAAGKEIERLTNELAEGEIV